MLYCIIFYIKEVNKKMAELYDAKIVIAGNVCEVTTYKEPILKTFKNKIEKQKREQTEEVKRENQIRSIRRTTKRIRTLANANYVPGRSSFLTLTFKENLTDYDVAFSYWDLFKKRVEYKIKQKLQYLGVVEFQTKYYEETGRRAIHFHICLFNVDYLDQQWLYETWNKVTTGGGVNIKALKEVDNIGAYLTHYLGKDLDAQLRFEEYTGKKRYFQSRNLKEPEEVLLDRKNKFDLEEFKSFMQLFENNVVYEYVSNPIEIYKKGYVEYQEEVLMEQSTFEGLYMKSKEKYIVYEDKKKLSASLSKIQQIHYKQIVFNSNYSFRQRNN